MTEHIPGQEDPSDDPELVSALTAMLERRVDGVEAQPDLAAVRADGRSTSSSGQPDGHSDGRPLDSRRRVYQVALIAAVLLIIGGGMIALGSRSADTDLGPAAEPTADTDPVLQAELVPDPEPEADAEAPPDAEAVPNDEPTDGEEAPDEQPSDEQESPSTADEGDGPMINQAEPDLRFDFGDIVRIEQVDGVDWIWFDRSGFGEDQIQGPEHQSEPRYELATDWHGGINVNPKLRTYPLAPEVQVLQIDPEALKRSCAFEEFSGPTFIESDVPTMLAAGADRVSLSFDEQVRVILVRDQMNC